LVADDDRDIRDLVAVKLQNAGFEVITVGDGAEALAAARKHQPDLAILDVMMQGLSGLEVVRQLREDPDTQSIPAILLTAKSQEFDVKAGLSLGAADYVIKPFSPRELLQRVNAVLDQTEP
jgi:DNA-binding response OmpR family regulator